MASTRPARVRELMKHELALILQRDFEWDGALVTVNDVDLTPDFKEAHVYIGVMGREDLQNDALAKLRRATGHISAKLSKRVILRNTPHLHFKLDDSIERGVRVLNIMQEIDRQIAESEAAGPPRPGN